MRGLFGFVSILIVAGIGFYLYSKQATSLGPAGTTMTPRASIDTTGVQNDLLALANGERRHFAAEGKYVSIDELISNGDVSMQRKERGNYQYSADVGSNNFRITATYDREAPPGVPHSISIDETMEIHRD